MSLVYTDQWLDIHQGDCREVLRDLPAESVDCVITSPPYWGLRDYGTATWEGGDPDCDHQAPVRQGVTGQRADRSFTAFVPFREECGKCGATRQDQQIGLEGTPEEYVANMVAVFREVRRVLKPSGTVWLNLGDSYGAGGGAQVAQTKNASHGLEGMRGAKTIAPKQLAGIPWRVAFALQADGWYLRSDIIWAKKNGMPESVTDRPTRSHEYIFLLTKSARYFYDIDAVREQPAESTVQRLSQNDGHPKWEGARDRGFPGSEQSMDINKMLHPAGRNMRDVWWIATRPYPGAHFAVFPPELVEPCVKAGSSEKGVCPECGAPWERLVERKNQGWDGSIYGERAVSATGGAQSGGTARSTLGSSNGKLVGIREPVGWQPTCAHEHEPAPAVVLDPFAGSGTTAMVANRFSRRAILIDLNPDYVEQMIERNSQTPLGLTA